MNHARFTVESGRLAGLTVHWAWPDCAPPASGWPLSVVLDEKQYWLAVGAQRQANASSIDPVATGVVVGLGEHTPTWRQRFYTPLLDTLWQTTAPQPVGTGMAAQLQQCLSNIVLPRLHQSVPLDKQRFTLAGHSLAALFVLQALLQGNFGFNRYLLSSPSVWWANFYPLELARYEGCPPSGLGRPDIYISVGEHEQGLTPADLLLSAAHQQQNRQRREQRRMVAGAKELAAILQRRNLGEVHFTVVPDADHGSASAFAWQRLFV